MQPARPAGRSKPAWVRWAKPVPRRYTSGGAPISATSRQPAAARCSAAAFPAAAKSRSMQVSPRGSAGNPISTEASGRRRSSGSRTSRLATSITMIASTSEPPVTRCRPVTPSSWVSSSTSWPWLRAAVTTAVAIAMMTGT